MTDPVSLGPVGAVVLREAVKFLYSQSGDVLKRWREHKAEASEGLTAATTQSGPLAEPLPFLEGQFSSPAIDFELAGQFEGQLRLLRRSLNNYVEGTEPADPDDHDLLLRVDVLRRLLETIFGRHITLKGETRPLSGTPIIVGNTDVQRLVGDV